jgi:hypothetical protein
MTAKKNLVRFCVLFLILFAVGAGMAQGCVGTAYEPVHFFKFKPDFPLSHFIDGRLGIIQPTYARIYLYCAYRWLSGAPLNPAEQAAVTERLQERLKADVYEPTEVDKALQAWEEMRLRVSGALAIDHIHYDGQKRHFRVDLGMEFANYFLNINRDAFATARATLDDLIRRFGANGREVAEWLKAQDQVFSNQMIIGRESIPAAAENYLPQIIKVHRDYQIACAYFYSGQYAKAEELFMKIAADKTSPWQAIAPYLRARALIRHATVDSPEGTTDEASLLAAEKLLKEIIAAPAAGNLHAACRGLLGYLYGQLRPQARMIELGRSLCRPGSGGDFHQYLEDYLQFFNRYEELFFRGQSISRIHLETVRQADDLSDWIWVMKSEDQAAAAYALAKWQMQPSLPWLVAALVKANIVQEDVMTAAAKIDAASPAYLTVAYHLARLRTGNEGRAILDAALKHPDCAILTSARNRLRLRRAELATSLEDFYKYCDGPYAGEIDLNEGFSEMPVTGEWSGDIFTGKPKSSPSTIFPGAGSLVSYPAIAERVELILHPPSEGWKAPWNVQVAWLTAVLLERYDLADRLVPILIGHDAQVGRTLTAYLNAREPVAKRFYAVLAMLRFPWSGQYGNQKSYLYPFLIDYVLTPETATANFFVEPKMAARETAGRRIYEAELKEIKSRYSSSPAFFFKSVQARLEQDAADPNLPEALHRIVKNGGEYSKKAFQLLHKHFPRSAWAKKTKYWY